MDNIFLEIFDRPQLSNPKALLENYSELLSSASKGKVVGVARSINLNEKKVVGWSYSVASEATKYSYRLFTLIHAMLLYPCAINMPDDIIKSAGLETSIRRVEDAEILGIHCEDEDELKLALERIFTSAKVKSIIHAIYSQG